MKPLAIDLYCGLGGWAEGFLAEGYRVIGFDIERHDYGTGGYPGQLVLQDVLTLCGYRFKDAAVIVASPPCQKYSYMAMPWKRSKALAKWYRESPERTTELNAPFDACWRIQAEASQAAGRHIPLIVENVKGAQPWVGRSRWHFGSFYLWGDVPALMPIARSRVKVPGFNFHQHEKTGESGGSFQSAAVKVTGQDWNRFAKTGEVSPHWRMEVTKTEARLNIRDGHSHTRHLTNPAEHIKNEGGSWFGVAHNTESGVNNNPVSPRLRKDPRDGETKVGGDWFGNYAEQKAAGTISPGRLHGKNSTKRKAASAQIAKIPFPLARHIAQCFRQERAA